MSVVEKITKTIDEVMFRRLLLDELRQLNSNIARITYSLEMVFPAPPEQSYTRNPEDSQIDYANEGPEPSLLATQRVLVETIAIIREAIPWCLWQSKLQGAEYLSIHPSLKQAMPSL